MTSVLRKEMFHLPEGVIYLDGNSLGPLPKAVPERLQKMLTDEWGDMLIKGWNTAGWMDQPARVGNKVATLIGAPDGTVVLGDTLSIKVFQAVAAAIKMRPERRVILSDTGNFPTDVYMANGLAKLLDQGYEVKTVDPAEVTTHFNDDVAAVMLTQVDYRTGRLYDMNAVTKLAHEAGAVMIWDLAHSAGALPVDLVASNCEFAIGCTYKYLNSGPGGPAFIYVRQDLQNQIEPALSGWLGHDAPFDFDLDYRPGQGIERMRVGTPSVMQSTSLEVAMEIWEGIDMHDIRAASIGLQELFIAELEAQVAELEMASPRNPQDRGSQVSFRFSDGYAAMQAIIERGVIGDFRAPDIMRFGFTPLYIDEGDVRGAVAIIADVMNNRLWDAPKYKQRNRVT